MDRFTPDTLHSLAVALLVGTVGWCMVAALRHRRAAASGRVDAFLRYRSTATQDAPITSGLLRATLMASAFSLASAIYVYVDWAVTDGMFVLWSPIAWATGAGVLYALRRRIFTASRGAWTLHAFLRDRFDSVGLMRLASSLTAFVFLLQVAAEVYVGLAVLQVVVGGALPLWMLSLLIGVVFVGYSVIGGLPSVLMTDRLQYRLMAFALLLAALTLFDNGGATAVERIVASIAETFVPSGSGWIVFAGLFALNIPLFVTDMSVWQRVGAASSTEEVTKALRALVPELLGWMGLLVCLGTGFAMFFEPAAGQTAAQAMLGYFRDSMVFPILVAGFVAALLSTGDTFLLASVQTLLVDWKYANALRRVSYDPERLDATAHRAMLRDSRVGVVALGLGSILLGHLFFEALPSLLDLLFVLFGLQTALTPVVVWGLFHPGADNGNGAAGIRSVVAGGIVALVCLVLALTGVELLGVTMGLWAPIGVLAAATVAFIAGGPLDRRRTAVVE